VTGPRCRPAAPCAPPGRCMTAGCTSFEPSHGGRGGTSPDGRRTLAARSRTR
jgi:hypothetical protein